MTILIGGGKTRVVDVEQNYLMVCMCENTCSGAISMKELGKMYPDVRVLIHVKNGEGEIVPVGGDE